MYKMVGFDENWIITDAKNRFATYTNLNSGDYIFQVKAANNSGNWSNVTTKLKVKILPPPWKTGYAILGYLIFFNLLLFVIVRYAIIQTRQRNQIKFDQLEKERMNSLYQMKMRFFTDVSHEFRTPLSLIIGPVDDILNEPFISDTMKAKVIMIQRNCKRLINLVDELMTFRKIDLGIIDLKVSNNDLVSFVSDIVHAFQPLAERKGIHLKFIAPWKVENVWIDPWKMEKVMNNLISNALKNTPENGVIEVSVEPPEFSDLGGVSTSAREIVSILVEDNGKGIDNKDIPSIFDRFFQTRTTKGGTGVGLALTKSLVELHKGSISVQSTPGEGTCFKVMIPLGKEHFSKNQLADESESVDSFIFEPDRSMYADVHLFKTSSSAEPDAGSKPLLLIVEDNLEVREYVRMIFSGHYQVLEAGNGLEALHVIGHENPDVVISDVMMPEMDGIELCQKIKTDIETCHIPVILLTARTATENIVEGIEVGADLYIPKPFQPELLKLQVENLISSRNKIIQKFRSGEIFIPKELTKHPLDELFLEKIINMVMKNLDNDNFSVEELGETIGMSRSNLFRKLKAITGQTPMEFIYFIRIKHSMELLLERRLNVSEIAYEVGFKSPSSFSKSFKSQFGKSPSEYLKERIGHQKCNS
jgi:signal transduction histidine kinase/DNA-binding response OmpR family regulator